jgi:hypothetical protein
MTHICTYCNKKLRINNLKIDSKIYDATKHFLLCKNCVTTTIVCSKSKCKEMYLLTDTDLIGIKILYIANLNNSTSYYLYSDIETIITNKYGNVDSLKKKLKKRESRKQSINEKKQKIIAKRKQELINALDENKLEFNNYGDTFMYINYGKPDIETIIKKEVKKTSKRMTRRRRLSKALSKVNIKLDETLESVNNYINNNNNNTLDEVVRAVEIEYFFKYKTDYDELSKTMDYTEAKDIAMQQYMKKYILKQKFKDITISFD